MKTTNFEPDVKFTATSGEEWQLYFEKMELHRIFMGWLFAKTVKKPLHVTEDGRIAFTEGAEVSGGLGSWTVIFPEDVQSKWLEWCKILSTRLVESMCDEET